MSNAGKPSMKIVIHDGMPFTEDEKGMHRSSIAELVAEIERLNRVWNECDQLLRLTLTGVDIDPGRLKAYREST